MSGWAVTRSRALTALLTLLTMTAGVGHASDLTGVALRRLPQATQLDAAVNGVILDYALLRNDDGTRRIVLLVGDAPPIPKIPYDDERDDAPPLPPCAGGGDGLSGLRLYELIVSREAPRIHRLAGDIPPDAGALGAVDIDADGSDELLLASPGKLYRVAPDGLRLLVDNPDVSWEPGSGLRPALGIVTTAGLGKFARHGPAADGSGWGVRAQVDLPVRGEVWNTGLRIHNALPVPVAAPGGGSFLFATEPQAVGTRRLRVDRIDLRAGGGSSTECWCRLPEPEVVLASEFLRIDGETLMLVSTSSAEKLSMFAERRLRLFPLRSDRSRLGHAPVFATRSRMNLWQEGHPVLRDVNGDGRDDLVLAYWKGLSDDRVVLDAYLRLKDGWFDPSPRTTAFNVDDADRRFLRFGDDVTGDGLADLLVRSGGRLVVYPGLGSTSGKKLVDRGLSLVALEADPEADRGSDAVEVQIGIGGGNSVAVSETFSALDPALVDLDADGTPEIVVLTSSGGGTAFRFHAVWVQGSSPGADP